MATLAALPWAALASALAATAAAAVYFVFVAVEWPYCQTGLGPGGGVGDSRPGKAQSMSVSGGQLADVADDETEYLIS